MELLNYWTVIKLCKHKKNLSVGAKAVSTYIKVSPSLFFFLESTHWLFCRYGVLSKEFWENICIFKTVYSFDSKHQESALSS